MTEQARCGKWSLHESGKPWSGPKRKDGWEADLDLREHLEKHLPPKKRPSRISKHKCPMCKAPARDTTRIMGTKQTFWECPNGHRWGNAAWRARTLRDWRRQQRQAASP